MAIGRISGPLLAANLLRENVDLAVETDLLYIDVGNRRVGINTSSPSNTFDVVGTINSTGLTATQATIDSNLALSASQVKTTLGNITIAPGTVSDVINLNGSTELTGTLNVSNNFSADGNIDLGTTASDTLTVNATVDSNISPNQTELYDLGTATTVWRNMYTGNIVVDDITLNNRTITVTSADSNLTLSPNGIGRLIVSTQSSMTIPVGPTSARPTTPVAGDIRYNTTRALFEGYNGISWKPLERISDLDDDTYVTAESTTGADEDVLSFYAANTLSTTINASRLDAIRITVDDISIDGNTVQTETLNTNLILNANGTGTVNILKTTNVTGNITASGNATITGSVTAASFSGDGASVTNVNAALLQGQNGAHYLDYPNFTNRPGIFKTFTLSNATTGFTWNTVGSITADVGQDTAEATLVSGPGIVIDADAANDAIRFQHADTSSATDLTPATRQYVTGLVFDTYGHVTGYSTSVDDVPLGTATTGNYVATASGSNGVSVTGSGTETAAITISGVNATTSTRGVASFNSANFSVATGAVSSNAITLGTSSLNLGSTTTSVQGLTLLEIDNLSLDGSTISSITANSNINLAPNGTGNVSVSSRKITNLADPTNPQDAATKAYVDSTAEGLSVKQAVIVATTGNLDATYDNGASGVGATLTANSNGALPAIDGFSAWVVGNGILVKDQTNQAHNGRYDVTQIGDAGSPWILTRSDTFDENTEIPGSFVFVREGNTLAATGWVATVATTPMTVGTTDIEFIQFSGSGTFQAGAGLELVGTEFSHTDTSTVANLTTANTGGNVIQNVAIEYDTFGHVTSRTFTAVDLDNRYYTQTLADSTFLDTTETAADSSLLNGQAPAYYLNYTNFTNTPSIFQNISVTGTDSGNTWSTTGSIAADTGTDTATFVSGTGIVIESSATTDAIRVSHGDTSTAANLSVSNTGGNVLQGISFTLDDYGHITTRSTTSIDLDTRYYTQTLAGTTFLGISDTAADSSLLESQNGAYYLNYNNFANTPTIGDATITINAGTGLGTGGTFTTNQTSASTVTLTNTDRGSSQNIFKNIAVAGQSTVVADTNNDTITLVGGTNTTITTDAATDTITFSSTDNYVTGLTFATGTGILSATRSGGLSTLTVGLDGRYLTSESDTLATVTSRGATTSNAISVGAITASGNILPEANNTRNIGSASLTYNTVYATLFNGTATEAYYADLAENYKTDRIYEPGTVVMFGGTEEITESDSRATRKVAGIISTAPAYLMNTQLEDGQPVALKGRVPCKVVGPVRKGDMLIASDIPGVAMASEEWIGGAMIGKSIETNLEEGPKVVEVAVGVL